MYKSTSEIFAPWRCILLNTTIGVLENGKIMRMIADKSVREKGWPAIADHMMEDPQTNGHRPASKQTNMEMLMWIQIQIWKYKYESAT